MEQGGFSSSASKEELCPRNKGKALAEFLKKNEYRTYTSTI